MIEKSFIFLDRVGYKKELKIWEQGLRDWKDFQGCDCVKGFSGSVKARHDRLLDEASSSLEGGDTGFFLQRLKPKDVWRLYPDLSDEVCFLDIETTGLGFESDITVVGLYDGVEPKLFVQGDDLSEESLACELERYQMIVTFYGSGFDLPFIKSKFPAVDLEKPHLDLCFASRRVGLKGGLKQIERQLGIARDDDILGIDGFEAVRLWRKWERQGDEKALQRLLEYNRADVVNLKNLAEEVVNALIEKTYPFS